MKSNHSGWWGRWWVCVVPQQMLHSHFFCFFSSNFTGDVFKCLRRWSAILERKYTVNNFFYMQTKQKYMFKLDLTHYLHHVFPPLKCMLLWEVQDLWASHRWWLKPGGKVGDMEGVHHQNEQRHVQMRWQRCLPSWYNTAWWAHWWQCHFYGAWVLCGTTQLSFLGLKKQKTVKNRWTQSKNWPKMIQHQCMFTLLPLTFLNMPYMFSR